MRHVCALLLLPLVTAACGGAGEGAAPAARGTSGFVEGRDYVVLERVRFLDEMGFDRPVEAMSVLLPRGWRSEGGVRWKGVQECRGEMITWHMSASSPDGAIRFDLYPVRSYVWYLDGMLQQSARQAAQQGGCAVNPPFEAAQYLEELARQVGGASVSDIRRDESLMATVDRINNDANAASRQYGTGMDHSGSAVFATFTWPDGTRGLANVGVLVASKQGRDMFTGMPNGFASSTVFHQVVMRYPADREAEAVKLFGAIQASHRVNPVWQQAKDNFMMQLGNIEHAGRMERLRLQGEQAAAYAKSQSEASDARMRSWERQQASSDRQQKDFIQTIREVETWKDASGSPVELSAGYSHGWSKPDGSYILTNNSLFDPAVALKENWVRMEKPPR